MSLVTIIKGEPVLYFEELKAAVEERLGRPIRDFSNAIGDYERWGKRKDYKGKDAEGKKLANSTIWKNEYINDPDGAANAPHYQDFWHLWIRFANNGRHIRSQRLVISKVRERFIKATGKPTRKQTAAYERVRDSIDGMEADDNRRKQTHFDYLKSFQADYMLEWTVQIFDEIYKLIPEYIDARIQVRNHTYE